MKAIILLLLLPLSAFAQTQTTGRLAGTIKDQNSALIVGASVLIVNQATGEERTLITGAGGNYAFSFLTSGVYRIRVEAEGFNILNEESITISITETTTLDLVLTVAGVVEEATVNGTVPLVRTDGPTLGQVFDQRTISNLPLATRNFTQLLGLTSGANTYLTDNTVVGRNSQNVSVNGARVSQNNFQINGIDANAGIGAGLPLANPATESIAEFKVQTSLYDATYGRAGGGNIQIITKSGSNKFSGAVYDYFSDTSLTANNPYLKAVGAARPVLERNIFGAVLGGAIKKDRAFFFVSYQTTRERNGASRLNSLSTNVLIDPRLTNDRSEAFLLATFKLPSIHPTSLLLLNARLANGQFVIPTPQANGRYSGSAISLFRDEQFNANFDYRLAQNNFLSVKFFFSNAPQFLARRGAANVPGFGIEQTQNNRLLAIQDIHTFSSDITNEARIGYNFVQGENFPNQPLRDVEDLRIPRLTATTSPGLGLVRIGTDANGIKFGTGVNQDRQTTAPTTSFTDTISITRGRHSVRFGAEFRYYEFNVTNNFLTRGLLDFANFTEFLIGVVSLTGLANGITDRALRTTDYNFFVQDDWKISPRLKLNLGLRYELDLPPYDTRGRISAFDASLYRPNPLGGLPLGGIVQAGNAIAQYDVANVPNVSARVGRTDTNNFAPRIGFAYSILKSNRIVVRGGYGIYYSRPSFQYLVNNMYLPPYYYLSGSRHLPVQDAFPYVPAQNEFPLYPIGSQMFGNSFDRNNRIPYAQQYNAGLQFELSPEVLLEVAYVGARGLNLYRRVGINQASLAGVGNPVNGITTNTPANAQIRAPFQGIVVSAQDVTGFNQDKTNAESNYNSLQGSLTRRLARGLQFLVSYTFSKSIDNASGSGGGAGTSGVIDSVDVGDTSYFVGDQLSDNANRGLSNFDRPHRVVLSFVWELPKPAFANRSKTGRLLFSGWQVSAITTAMSGLPIDVMDSAGSSFYLSAGGGGGRPNFVPGESTTSNIPAGYYFNPYAFARAFVQAGHVIPSSRDGASAGERGTDFGNVGRNILRGPSQFNTDVSVIKRFRMSDSRNIEFRTDIFNLFNHVNYANPISDLAAVNQSGGAIDGTTGQIPPGRSGDFGRIISTSNNPRIVQFALKYSF
jgi:hypothetical protein